MSIILVYIIISFAFFGNLIVGLNYIAPEVTLITEVAIYLLFIISILERSKTRYDGHLMLLFSCFLIFGFASAFLNNRLDLGLIASLRLLLRYYVFYLAVINLDFKDTHFVKINALLFLFLIAQLPASFIRFVTFGISEMTIGTWGTQGGGVTTVITIVAIGYFWSYYAYHKRRFLYILLIVAYIIFGIFGSKRALLFFYPIAFFGIYFLIYVVDKKISPLKQIGVFVVIFVLALGSMLATMRYIPTLNPERQIGGSIDFAYVFEFAESYETAKNHGRGMGRASTTLVIVDKLWEGGVGSLFFGLGPGSLLSSLVTGNRFINDNMPDIHGSYGRTGLALVAAEYGLLGASCFVIFFMIISKNAYIVFRTEKDPYWKAFLAGTVIMIVYLFFIFLVYNDTPITDDTITPILFYAAAIVRLRRVRFRREFRKHVSQKLLRV